MKCNVFDYCRFAKHEGFRCTIAPAVCQALYPALYIRAESLADRARVAEARRYGQQDVKKVLGNPNQSMVIDSSKRVRDETLRSGNNPADKCSHLMEDYCLLKRRDCDHYADQRACSINSQQGLQDKSSQTLDSSLPTDTYPCSNARLCSNFENLKCSSTNFRDQCRESVRWRDRVEC